jgi:energy-converting hydrogenase Eha subunit A
MSNMRKVDPEVINNKGQEVIVFDQIARNHSLVKANRYLLMLVIALMSTVLVLGFVILPGVDILDHAQGRRHSSTVAYTVENPVISEEISALKSQLVGLISGSIESKLRILEQSIKIGSLSASMGTIEDLRNDVKVLRSYSEPTPKKSVDTEISQQMISELSDLKNLIYLIFASCGLMIAALAGLWLKHRFRLPDSGVKSYLGSRKNN